MSNGESFWKSNEGCGAAIFDSFVFGFLGWLLVYHDFNKGGVSMFALAIALRLVMFLGLIPVLGQIGYWYLSKSLIIPFVLNYFQISSTWLVDVIFWFNLIISAALSFWIFGLIRRRRDSY